MITEEQYFELLEKSKDFCKSLSIHYIDFLHDIITESDITDDNIKNLFYRKKWSLYKEPVIYSLDMDRIIGNPDRHTIYLYCYHCNQVLPESEFYKQKVGVNLICKKGYNEKNVGRVRQSKNHNINMKKSASKSRSKLTDYYIKDILRKSNIPITEKNILLKRQAILLKRSKKTIIKKEK